MEDSQVEMSNGEVFKVDTAVRRTDKIKTQRANSATKTKDQAKELKKQKELNKQLEAKLEARLTASRMPFVEDKRGREEEIDAGNVWPHKYCQVIYKDDKPPEVIVIGAAFDFKNFVKDRLLD